MLHFDPRAWPIRWRLTALNVGILIATLLLLGGVFLSQLERALVTITADHLRDQARPVLRTIEEPRLLPPGDRGRPPLTAFPFDLPRATGLAVGRLSGPDTGVLVFDTNGTLVMSSEGAEDVEAWPEPTASQLRAALGGAEQMAVVNQQTRRTLVLVLPIREPNGAIAGALEVTGSLELIDQLEFSLRSALIAGIVLAVLVAGIVGLRATRGALRPLDRVVRAARRIEAGNLDERLRLQRQDEIGELAEAFDSMLDRLAAVLMAQRRFVADAAHELRTPLTALGGMVEMLQLGADRGDRATIQHMLDTMEREIERLSRLVSDLLTLSRLDSDRPLTLAPLELAPLLTEVANQTRLLSHGQEIALRIDATPTIRGDADRLKQVLLNLAANALAFTPPDGRIEFRLDQPNGRARLTVTDTGVGIAPEVLPTVMDRFVRGDPSRARATGGSGLGLAIARGIVDAHGGTIALESAVGKGTSAIVQFPLSQPHQAPAHNRSSANVPAT